MGNSNGRHGTPTPSPVPPGGASPATEVYRNVPVTPVVPERLPTVHQKYYPAHCQRPYNVTEFFKSASLSNSLLTTGSQGSTPSPAFFIRKKPRLGEVSGWSSMPDVPSPCEESIPEHCMSVFHGRPHSSIFTIEPIKEHRISFYDSYEEIPDVEHGDANTDRTLTAEEEGAIPPDHSPSGKTPTHPPGSLKRKFLETPLPTISTQSPQISPVKPRLSPTFHGLVNPSDTNQTISFGPITSAVIGLGLRAKIRSISNWFLSGKDSQSVHSSTSFPHFPQGLKLRRWHSFKSSWSLSGSQKPLSGNRRPGSWRISSLHNRLKTRSKSTVSGLSEHGSTASLNSLADGRTPWPIPWLDAIFLPDFPNRAPVSERDFLILGTIARGAFGQVLRVCLKRQPDSIYAMKVQKKAEVINQDAVHQVKQEVSIHYSLCSSPFVTQLHFAWQNRSSLYMVLHYVDGYGDLHQLWRDEGPFPDELVAIYAAELAIALDYIHNCNVIFRDIKMENVLLDDKGHIQLVDFGLAKWLSFADRTRTVCGTLQYMAPEILHMDFYNHSVDWWSLGVLIHTLLVGEYPFTAGRDHTSMHIPQYEPPARLADNAQLLLLKLLCHDPSTRLSNLQDFKQEAFFNGLSFSAVQSKEVHPFDVLPKMRRCDTCNQDLDEVSVLDDATDAFGESYEAFQHFDYFDDDLR